MVLRYQLEDAGYACVQSATVEEGWEALIAEVPDAAVVDIRLPGVEGWVLLERMRNDGRFHDLPALVLTGLLEARDMDHARSLGCEYLGKPYAAQALLRKMEELIKARSDNESGTGAEPAKAAKKIKLKAVRVMLLLDSYQIEGNVYVPPELRRFSDAWESIMRDNRAFIPVTDARVLRGDSKEIATPDFIEVRKSELRGVFPMEQQHPQLEVIDGADSGS
jgi:CheY-like chemotaxis protein